MDDITIKEESLEREDDITMEPSYDMHDITSVVKQEPGDDVTDTSHHDMDDTAVLKEEPVEPMEEGYFEEDEIDIVSNTCANIANFCYVFSYMMFCISTRLAQ
jgi:hypothetical protein